MRIPLNFHRTFESLVQGVPDFTILWESHEEGRSCFAHPLGGIHPRLSNRKEREGQFEVFVSLGALGLIQELRGADNSREERRPGALEFTDARHTGWTWEPAGMEDVQ